jgi:hypothetical protein
MEKAIDVKKLTTEEQYNLIIEILTYNKELKTAFNKVLPNPEKTVTMEYIEKLIEQDFKRYDEVFRKLA